MTEPDILALSAKAKPFYSVGIVCGKPEVNLNIGKKPAENCSPGTTVSVKVSQLPSAQNHVIMGYVWLS